MSRDEEATGLDPQSPKLILEADGGPLQGRVFRFQQVVTILGRDDDCDVVLAGKETSRRHATIHFRAGKFWLGDAGTVNGTRLNGQLLSRPAPLAHGDVLQIGRSEFRIGLNVAPPPLTVRAGGWLPLLVAIPFLLLFIGLLYVAYHSPRLKTDQGEAGTLDRAGGRERFHNGHGRR